MMVGSSMASIFSTVRTPRSSISWTTRSLWTTWPRIAPRPPPAAKRFTFRSAMRTPEQNPYFAARFTFIGCRNIVLAAYNPRSLATSRIGAPLHSPLRRALAVSVRDLLLRVSAPAGHPAAHPRARRDKGRRGRVPDGVHARQRVFGSGDGLDRRHDRHGGGC